jgi:hypothetical protein
MDLTDFCLASDATLIDAVAKMNKNRHAPSWWSSRAS